jgi:hypothetical protein
MARVRTVEFLPEIFQTPANRQFLNATLDQLTQEPAFRKTQGFVGRKIGPGVNAEDRYVIEPTAERNNYQLEPGVIGLDPDSGAIQDAITYPGINAALNLQGANVTNADRLYTSDYYTWDPFVDFDKFVNYSQYYWLPGGPDDVDVFSTEIPLTDTFTVTRANGVYTFSGESGNNPVITLVRGGSYNFDVEQNAKEDINFRVANNSSSAFVIDYENNPTLTLVRGNTYTFTLVLNGPFQFFIKTEPTLGTTNQYNNGVTNNGAATGTITFTVPQSAPDTLYYVNPVQPNMRGVMNVVNARPGTGPGFWIQTDPGVNGRIPATPNISSRDVLGVVNNGEDLGTVTFNVPLSTAQDFYYGLPNIGNIPGKPSGTVDLVTNLKFNQINNVFLEPFLQANPTGIDGVTTLNGKTIVFLNEIANAEDGGWQITTQFDPLPNVGNVESGVGSYDSTLYDQTTDIISQADRYSVWQISYNTTDDGQTYMTLNNVLPVAQLTKFKVQYGTESASTSWYKNVSGYFEQIPLLTATKDLLFYQDGTDPEIFGQIRLLEENNSATIFISDIVGQPNYTSPNGVVFTNGLKVTFRGDVEPASYANNSYYVEGVGTAIKLLPVTNFVTPETYTNSLTIPYDSLGYDIGNYDGTENAPLVPDYLTINRASPDLNAWTRSNRWFHIDVINATAEYNNTVPNVDNLARARRPVLEFRAGTRLFDFGTQGKQPIDVIDFAVTDALTDINGATAYGIDGYSLLEGSRVIFAADIDSQVRNKIYTVEFIVPDTVPPLIAQPIINLVPAEDATVLIDQSVVCLSGNTLQGKSFYYDGVTWFPAQEKISVNQAPLFDVYDNDGISFGNRVKYLSSTFRGSKLFSYAQNSSTVNDPVLGFPLKYLSLENVGDILFDNNLYKDTFEYVAQNTGQTKYISEGFVRQYSTRTTYIRELGWQPAAARSVQRQQFQFTYDGSPLLLDVAVSPDNVAERNGEIPAIQLYVNSQFQPPDNYTYTTTATTTTITLTTTYVPGDIIEVAVISDQISKSGFYQVPGNLENNPLNANSETFTLGTIRSHYETIGQNLLTLQGPIIGANNSRDLGNIVPYGLQILQQSSPLTLAGYFQRSQQYNIFDAIEYNSREYIKFKSLLLQTVVNNDYGNMSIPNILDSAVAEITKGRTDINPFYWSDMLPTGAVYTETVYPITPITVPEFNTSQTYDYTSANFQGLSVYLTRNSQMSLLVRGQDYVVSADSPRITVTTPLQVGDTITLREYSNTAGNFVPNTPSKMGLYPKYVPQIFVDPNYTEPQVVIQGHDGSITIAFNDFRDDILLEFEKRIYNNIKTDGNPVPLVAEDVIPGFFRNTDYTQNEINDILNQDFLTWVGYNKLDYTSQSYNPNNEFTYNYSASGNKLNNEPLLGAWRGIYRYFYDTTSPNLTPWQMLGLSEKPSWWETRYGPAPYTRDNLVLWDDLELGLVAEPITPYINPVYARPGLTLAGVGSLKIINGGTGYVGQPTFVITEPPPNPYFETRPLKLGRSTIVNGSITAIEILDSGSGYITAPVISVSSTQGNGAVVVANLTSTASIIPTGSEGALLSPLESIVGAYDPGAFRKSWTAGDGGPVENTWWTSSSYPFAVMRLLALTKPAKFFSLFADRDLYKFDAEFGQYLYNGRYRISTATLPNQPTSSTLQIYGNGVSKASYINWIVDYNQQLGRNSTTALTTDLANLTVRLCYRMASFTDKQYLKVFVERSSPNSTNSSLLLPDDSYNLLVYKNQPFARVIYSSLIVERTADGYSVWGYNNATPYFNIFVSSSNGLLQTVSGGGASVRVPAQYTNNVAQVPYGYTFQNTTGVVDFILSYGKYLESQGLIFDDRENGYTLNWSQMATEFLYFSQQGWAPGTLINLNPSATTLRAVRAGAVADTIVSTSPEKLLLDQNRQNLPTRDLIVERDGNSFAVTSPSSQTISFLNMQFTNYESIVILDNTSVFNDLIYDPATGARQNRVRITAATTSDWDGTLDAQGFILNDLATIKQWQPNRKYTKGEIVLYKNNYWSAQTIVQPKREFDFNDWVKSDYTRIQGGLLPNIANKADQLANSYNTQVANLEADNDLLSYGLIGFRPRQYMVDLNLDDVSQVNLYQQFLPTKGTIRAAEVFTNADLGKESGEYNIYENWGVLVSTYGANAVRAFIELRLNEANLTADPCTVQVVEPQQTSLANQSILLEDVWRESYKLTSTDIFPTTYATNLDTALPSAGYVNINDIDITVFSLDDPSSISANIEKIGIGTTIWAAKSNSYDWNVYRCSQVAAQLTQLTDNLNGTSIAQFNQAHNLSVGDFIIVRYFNDAVDGVYRVLSVPGITSITIAYAFTNTNQTTITGTGLVFYLQTMRVAQASDIADLPYANDLIPGALAYVDNNGNGHWEVLQKQDPFSGIASVEPVPPIFDSGFGTSVAQTNNLLAILVGTPNIDSGTGHVNIFRWNSETDGYSTEGQLALPVANVASYGDTVAFGHNVWGAAAASRSLNDLGYVGVIQRNVVTGALSQTQLLLRPSPSIDPIRFGQSIAISQDERWMYIGAPNDAMGGKVYAYGRVDVESQVVTYLADGNTTSFNYSDNIVVDTAYRAIQLIVSEGANVLTAGVDYTVTLDSVVFNTAPASGFSIVIRRRSGVQFVGDGSTDNFLLDSYLYTVNNIDSFVVRINGQIQRPYIDYEYNPDSNDITKDVRFAVPPSAGDNIDFVSDTYWMYVDTIDVSGIPLDAQFGISVTTTTDGQQLIVGAKLDDVDVLDQNGNPIQIQAGSVRVFDRSVVNFLVDDATVTTYDIPGTVTEPVAVTINNQFLQIHDITIGGNTTTQYINGQVDINLDTNQITLLSNASVAVGDVLQIQTNQFQLVQKISANMPIDESAFGSAVDICSTNCSLYVGAPLDSSVLPRAGSVERKVNQSRVYGVTTNTVANPIFAAGDSLRVNNYDVAVPTWTNAQSWTVGNFVANGATIYRAIQTVPIGASIGNTSYWVQDTWINAWVYTINNSGIPNVTSLATANVSFVGDGSTKIFNVGTIYSATQYTGTPNTRILIDGVVQLSGFSWSNDYQQLNFSTAPARNSVITVVSGRITISVKNSQAGTINNKLTVLPGITGTAFDTFGFETFVYTQTITSPSPSDYAYFGNALQVDTGAINLVVAAPNGNIYDPVSFDGGTTYFDDRSTTFFDPVFNSGVVYTYDFLPSADGNINNPGKFVFGQQIYTDDIESNDQFGFSVNFTRGRLVVGAPGNDLGDSAVNFGVVKVFENPDFTPAWNILRRQQPVVDVNLINTVFMYDKLTSTTQTYFDFFDPLQGKILGAARRNIDYIGAVDPANYNTGTVHNQGTSWGSEHLGQIWWDTNEVRFIDPNQDDITYASRRWGQVFPGSRVDIYQWIESTVPPISYTGPGIPLSTTSYTVRSNLNQENIFVTSYYFWVRGVNTIDTNAGKTLSTTGIARYIESPRTSGIPYVALLNSSTVAIYNGLEYISAADTILHVGFDRQANDANIHQEYQFVADGEPDSFLNATLYRKLQDSFSGYDTAGNAVPDPFLSPPERYGVQFRPRQSMFVDRFMALQNYLVYANRVLKQYPIVETRNLSLLNSSEPEPSSDSGEWNLRLANLEELSFQNINAVPLGYRYLISTVSTQNGLWGIYQVVNSDTLPGQRALQLVRLQNYNTSRYWYHIDWYQPGYNSTIQPVAEVPTYSALSTLNLVAVPVGSSVKVTANAQGKFEIYIRTDLGWDRVGLQDGTLQFSEEIWNYAAGNFGFDVEVYDAQYFDQEPVIETRKIIQSINEQLFIGDLAIERNRSLILMFNYVYSEITAPEWLIKTSLIDVKHKIRALLPYQTYLQDNQDFVLDYIQEVKPYHVQIREFNLNYFGDDAYPGLLTDFDVPAYYATNLEVPQNISPVLQFNQAGEPYTLSGSLIENTISDAGPDAEIWTLDPWAQWYNNYLLNISAVTVIDGGVGYTVPPQVIVTGPCLVEPDLLAIINSAGQVVAIEIIDPGLGFSAECVITFVGGNGIGARAVATLSNNLVRNIKTTIKYDRCEYSSTIVDWEPNVAYDNGTQVRYANRVWEANSGDSSTVQGPTFDPAVWLLVDASTLSAADRTMGYYTPTVNQPGLSLPLLIDGIEYPGVQVTGVNFNQNTGYDIGNYDINPFDNITIGPEGLPTYDLGILDAMYASYYGLPVSAPVTGPVPPYPPLATDLNVDGGAYVDTYSSHAPEELVPGAEFDTLDLRVYTRPGADWEQDGHGFPLFVRNYEFDLADPVLNFADVSPCPAQVIVFNQTTGLELDQVFSCSVNWATQEITILAGAATGDTISVSVYELGGGNQLFNETYNGQDVGNTLIIPVEFSEIQELAIFVNGNLTTDYTYLPEWQDPGVVVTYNPVGSSGTTLVITNTLSIAVGSVVTGTGFTSNQTVVSKENATTLTISAPPDSTPAGQLTFKANTRQTKISFNTTYTSTDFLDVSAVGPTVINGNSVDYGWSVPQTQVIVADGSTLVYELDNSLEFTNPDCLIVTVNGVRARTSAGAEYVGDGSTAYLLPQRLGFDQSTIADSDVVVYVDGQPQVLNVDYFVEPYVSGDPREVIFFSAPTIGSQIQVYVRTGVQCFVSAGQLFFVSGSGLEPILGDVICVTTWNDTRQQNILPLVYVGPVTTGITVNEPYDSTLFDNPPGSASAVPGSFDFTSGIVVSTNDLQLGRPITNPDRLWVTLNGVRQFPGVDFVLSGEEVILHSGVLNTTDVVMITMFTESTVPASMAFRIFQDMRGVQAVYRITSETTTTLSQPLAQDADVINVEDASALSWPDIEANIWGVVMINGERIMYRQRDTVNNTISSLLRGTAGTGANSHPVGATVTDMGRENLLPEQFQNYVLSGSTLANGSNTVFEAEDINLLLSDSTIRDESVEVYVGGTLVTTGYTVTNNNPCEVTFDTAPPDGVEVTILVRRGVTWYAPGAGTASNGQPLQMTDTQAARFLRGLN